MSKRNKLQQSNPHPPAKPLAAQHTQVHVQHRSGPLPSPQELQAYNHAIPNGADRIVKMAEQQSAHRMGLETTAVQSQQAQAARGQYFGLFAAVIAILCATYAAVSGSEAFASVLGGTTVLGLAGAFVSGKYLQKKDLAKKAEASPEQPAQQQ